MTTTNFTLQKGTICLVPLSVSKEQVIKVKVAVVDHREIFGREEWLVTPIEGDGAAWMTTDRIASANA